MHRLATTALVSIFVLLLLPLSGRAAFLQDMEAPAGQQRAVLRTAKTLAAQKARRKEDEILVKFKAGTPAAARNSLNARHGSTRIRELKPLDLHHLKLKKGLSVEDAIKLYLDDPSVEYAEPNYLVQATTTPNDSYYNSTGSWGQPYQDMWGLYKMQFGNAWDITQGSSGVVVAVTDTGIDFTHVDIQGKIWTNPREVAGNYLDDDQNRYIDDVNGWNFDASNNFPFDDHGHGTHVSGTIAAATNNGAGIAGIAWNSKIMPLKFLDSSGSGDIGNGVAAIIYAADNGARVVNCSWGTSVYIQSLADAVNYAYGKGVVVVAAAGNDGVDASGFYPAALPHVFAVAATDYQDKRASFSNYGSVVKAAAPGVDILSLRAEATDMYGDGTHIVGTRYYRVSGTSVAAPHASGLAALILAQHPDWTPDQVMAQMSGTADDIGDPLVGAGRLNAYAALTQVAKPRINVTGHRFDDSAGGNGNGRLDAGETVGVSLTLQNLGMSAQGITISLSVSDPYVTVNTGSVSVGDLAAGSTSSTASTPLMITLSPQTPAHHQVVLNFTITANGGAYSKAATVIETASLYLSGGWPLVLNSKTTSHPVLADLNGDGVPEVVVVTDRVEVRKGDGTSLPGWPQLLPANETYGVSEIPVAVGDLDHDGHLEVVVATNTGIHAWHADGTPVAGFPIYPTAYSDYSANFNAVLLADLEGGGQGLDIIATSPTYQQVYAFRRDGTTLTGWPVPLPGAINTSGAASWFPIMTPAAGDIDGDGQLEVVVPAMDNHVYAWHRDGTSVSGWPIAVPYTALTVSLADVNHDGKDEVFFNSAIGSLYGYSGAGTPLAGWPQVCGPASFADFDGDGNLEIACSDSYTQILHADGTPLAGWPQQHGNLSSWAPAIGDLDGDGKPDLIIRDNQDQVYAWNSKGTLLSGYPLPLNGAGAVTSGAASPGSVALGDLNGDGTLDAVTGSGLADSNLYVMRLVGAGRPESALWPMFQGNARQTGEASRVTVVTSQLAGGTVGVYYGQTLAAGVGKTPYTWSLSSGTLPTGLTLASYGTLTGTPSTAGTFTFTLQVQDAMGDRATRQFTVTIARITITTSALPSAQVGVSYSTTAAASGGQAPYSWSVLSGSLPPGVILDAATGLIHGTPGAAGDFPLTLQVRDNLGVTASRPLDVRVYSWTARKDSGGNDYARAVTTDAQGNYFVTGYTDGTSTIRTTKYSPAGAELWTSTYTAKWAKGIAADASGNVYVAGTVANATSDCLLLKYDPAGNLLWSRSYDGGNQDYCNAVTVAPGGAVYLAGSSSTAAPDYRDLFLTMKYDANGNQLWHKIYDPGTPAVSTSSLTGVAADASGNAYVTGTLPGSGAVTGSLTIKYDASGNLLWSAPWTGTAQGIAAGGDGNVVVAGYDTSDYRTMPVALKYTASGNVLWSKEGPDYLPYQYATGVAIGADGSPYLAGYYSNGSTMDFFALRYDSAGNFMWGTSYDGGRDEYGRGIAVTGGIAYVTGEAYNGSNYDFLTIRLAPPAITTVEPAVGKPQTAYSQTFTATDGALPYTWAVSSGQLPPGLVLDPASGTLAGIPTTSGSYTFTIRVAGSDGLTSQQLFTLVIDDLASAGFSGTPRVGYAPLLVSFADTSQSGPTSWNWTFGDGATSTAAAPSHLYTAPGTYSVSLTDSNGTSGVTTLKSAYISVLGCTNSVARIARLGTASFTGISTGYASAADGDQLQLLAEPFAENVIFNRSIRISLMGGYDCGYTSSIADTPVTGSVRIQAGTVDIQRLRIR